MLPSTPPPLEIDDTLAQDAWAGLRASPRWLPSKHLYRGEGGALFEQICELPEYYPTRLEYALLERAAKDLLERTQPASVIELGAGSARKTTLLFERAAALGLPFSYWPVDIDAVQLARTRKRLALEYPRMEVHEVVADMERPLVLGTRRPKGPRLAVVLGGTIGNFDPVAARRLLQAIGGMVGPGGYLLLGTDRVKEVRKLERAYNDSRGVTAQFNRNLLAVLNAELGADFALDAFRHHAFYAEGRERIEMHLVASREQMVRFDRLDWTLPFDKGQTIRTEISRKFTLRSATAMLAASGFHPVRHYEAPGGAYSLWLARVEGFE